MAVKCWHLFHWNNISCENPACVSHLFQVQSQTNNIGKNCLDIILACYVLIILSPSIIIHVLWSFLDSYGPILVKIPKQSYIELEKRCGPKKPVWYILLIVYGYSISTALITVAIKTRKIRHKQFKDSRKVNMYLFCFTVVSAMTFGYWLFLDQSNTYEHYLSLTPVHIGLSMIVLLCQFLLFIPKVLPPFKRYIMAKCFNRTVYNCRGTNLIVTITRVQWLTYYSVCKGYCFITSAISIYNINTVKNLLIVT